MFFIGGTLLTGCASKKFVKHQNGHTYTKQQDSAPEKTKLAQVRKTPDAVPEVLVKSRYGNPKQYYVFGKKYTVMNSSKGYKQRGKASWYGEKFHGYNTSSGIPYDMYEMTAAHKSLPLPTFVQVKNLDNGRRTIVKVNDRGPFHEDRIIDLSYAAAVKLGVYEKGVANVFVEAIDPVVWLAKNQKRGPMRLASKKQAIEVEGVVQLASLTGATAGHAVDASQNTRLSETSLTSEPSKETLALNQTRLPKQVLGQESTAQVPGTYTVLQVASFTNPTYADNLRQRLKDILKHPVSIATNEVNGQAWHKVHIGPITEKQQLEQIKMQLAEAQLPQPVEISRDVPSSAEITQNCGAAC